MAIVIERNKGLERQSEEQFGLEGPYCGIYSHMTLQKACGRAHNELRQMPVLD